MDALPDGKDSRLCPSAQMTLRNNNYELAGQDDKTNLINGHEAVSTLSVKASCMDVLPLEKRSRKLTKRISLVKSKLTSVMWDLKNWSYQMKESSVKAIQVPFGSLVNKECPKEHSCDTVQHVDSRKLMSLSKCKRVTPENQDAFVSAICPKIQDEFFTYQKKKGAFVNATCKKKRRTGHPKKWIHRVVHESPNNKHDHSAVMRVKKMDDHPTKKQQKKRKSLDEDKWRNLLEASSIQESRKQHVFYGAVYCLYKCQQRVKKHSVAWRPSPKSILCQVCELATMYPYPKGQRPELLIDWDSPDRSADVTLSDYGRILCGINGNGRKDEYRSDSVFMTDPPVNRDNKLNALKLQHIRA